MLRTVLLAYLTVAVPVAALIAASCILSARISRREERDRARA